MPVLCGDFFLLSFVCVRTCVTGGSRNLWRSTFGRWVVVECMNVPDGNWIAPVNGFLAVKIIPDW